MRGRVIALFAVLAIGMGYLSYPFWTLYSIKSALRLGDKNQLVALIDWYSVREGIKEDICDLVMDEPVSATPPGQLPPFGTGFVKGVAGSAVDKSVTADALVDMAKQEPADADPRMQPTTHVSWAFFSSPTTFTVKVRAADFPKPVHVELGLTAHGWRVVRVRLPAELLEQTHWKV